MTLDNRAPEIIPDLSRQLDQRTAEVEALIG